MYMYVTLFESFYKKVEIYVHAHINVLFCYAILKSLL